MSRNYIERVGRCGGLFAQQFNHSATIICGGQLVGYFHPISKGSNSMANEVNRRAAAAAAWRVANSGFRIPDSGFRRGSFDHLVV